MCGVRVHEACKAYSIAGILLSRTCQDSTRTQSTVYVEQREWRYAPDWGVVNRPPKWKLKSVTHTDIHTHAQTHTHTRARTHTHTHTHTFIGIDAILQGMVKIHISVQSHPCPSNNSLVHGVLLVLFIFYLVCLVSFTRCYAECHRQLWPSCWSWYGAFARR